MEVNKAKMESGVFNIILKQDSQALTMSLSDNLDLSWTFKESKQKTGTVDLMITKENYRIFSLFEELYNRIKNCDIFRCDDNVMMTYETEEERRQYIEKLESLKKDLLSQQRNNLNYPFYDGLVEWHCDDDPYDESNILKIYLIDNDSFLVRFESNKTRRRSIRFSNSGSRYTPYNNIFMEMFNKLQDYDLEDYQIHIEEFMYQKKMGSIKSA